MMLRKPIPPLLWSQWPMMMLPTLIGEVSFMLFLILKQPGRSRQRDEIIELSVVILDCSGVEIEDAFFSEFVKPTKPIPPFITELTSITNDDVSTAESFAVVGDAFIGFIQQHADEFGAGMVDHIILVGHNRRVFDIFFFIYQLGVHGIEQRLIEDGRFSFGMDTL
jgi:DNA polymerase III alpha subunit (gram-positive type)